jgi:hypothetical protein
MVMKILNAVLGILFFFLMTSTDDVGEKIEYATLSLMCSLAVLSMSDNKKES